MGMFDDTPAAPDLNFEKQEGYGEDGAGDQNNPYENEGDRNPDLDNQAGEQEQPEGNEPPEDGNGLILGKYKSVEDLARAHEALQKRLGDMRNELGQLRQQYTTGNKQMQPQQDDMPQWTEEQWKQFDRQFQQDFVRNPGRAVFNLVNNVLGQVIKPIQETIMSQFEAQQRENAIMSELGLMVSAINDAGELLFPGVEELAPQIDSFLEKNPYLLDILAQQGMARAQGQLDETSMGVLEVIYKAVQAESALNAGKQAYQKGLQQGQKSVQAKGQARLPNAGARKTGGTKTPEEQIVDEIFAHRKGGYFD